MIAQSGLPSDEATSWGGFAGPVRMPAVVVDRLNAETMRALRAPEIADAMMRRGGEALGSTPKAFGSYLLGEIDK